MPNRNPFDTNQDDYNNYGDINVTSHSIDITIKSGITISVGFDQHIYIYHDDDVLFNNKIFDINTKNDVLRLLNEVNEHHFTGNTDLYTHLCRVFYVDEPI